MPGIYTPFSQPETVFDHIRICERDTPKGEAAFPHKVRPQVAPWPALE
jgi:hypothetical protein